MLRRLLSVSGFSLSLSAIPAMVTAGANEERKDPKKRKFMEHAFEMKAIASDSGDQPFGAVIVKDEEIVGRGPSQVLVNQDPTAHAEMVAIRDAANRLGTADLSGCTLYSTSKPCRMCETAAYWAGLERSYYTAEIIDGGPPGYSSC